MLLTDTVSLFKMSLTETQVSIYVAVAHQTSHLAPDTRITTNDSSQTAKLGTAYSF